MSKRFGVDEITDELLMRETNVDLKIGVGANNLPQERIQAFAQAWGVTAQTLAPFIQGGLITPPRPKVGEIIQTIFGPQASRTAESGFSTGWRKRASRRSRSPTQVAMADQQNKTAALQIQAEKAHLDHQAKMAAIAQKREELDGKDHLQAVDQAHDAARQARDHSHDALMREREALSNILQTAMRPHPQPGMGGQAGPAMDPGGAAAAACSSEAGERKNPPRSATRRFMAALQNLSRPLRVQRGEDGSIIGVESVVYRARARRGAESQS